MDLGIDELEHSLDLPLGFFDALYDEDDWSFVIKLHSFLEAHLSMVLAESMNKSALDSFTYIPMSNAKYGKAVIASSIGLIPKDMEIFIRALSEFRNLLAHDIRNVGIDIGSYYRSQDKAKKASLYKKFGFGLRESGGSEETNKVLFENRFKKAIHLSGLATVYHLSVKSVEIKANRLNVEVALKEKRIKELGNA